MSASIAMEKSITAEALEIFVQALEIINAELSDITQERDNALHNLKSIQDQPVSLRGSRYVIA